MKQRQSNIELLRIISILMIVAMHIIGNAFHSYNPINRELLILVNSIGNTGVTIFVLISGYFGIHSSVRKLTNMMSVIWFYSITSYIVDFTYFGTGITFDGMVSALLPVLSKKYWFITCYMILFCLSPYLNRIATALTKKEFLKLIAILGLFFVLAPTILITEIENDGGKGIVNFILAYFIGQYLRIYGFPKLIQQKSTIILLALLATIFVSVSIHSAQVGSLTMKFARDNNLFIILASITIFYKFVSRSFYSVTINFLAGFVFPIYMMQALLLKIAKPWLREHTEDDDFIVYMMATIVAVVVITIFVESLRRYIFRKPTDRLIAFIERQSI